MKNPNQSTVLDNFAKHDVVFQACIVVLRRYDNMGQSEKKYFKGIASTLKSKASHSKTLYRHLARKNSVKLAYLVESYDCKLLGAAIRKLTKLELRVKGQSKAKKLVSKPSTGIPYCTIAERAEKELKRGNQAAKRSFMLAANQAYEDGFEEQARILYQKAQLVGLPKALKHIVEVNPFLGRFVVVPIADVSDWRCFTYDKAEAIKLWKELGSEYRIFGFWPEAYDLTPKPKTRRSTVEKVDMDSYCEGLTL